MVKRQAFCITPSEDEATQSEQNASYLRACLLSTLLPSFGKTKG